MPIMILLIVSILLTGCINIGARMQPEDTSVKAVLQGEDCATIFLGFGFGRVTIEHAKADGLPPGTRFTAALGLGTPITKVRSVELTDTGFLGLIGSRCIEVIGEP